MLGSSLTITGQAQQKSATKHASPAALKLQTQTAGAMSVVFSDLPDGAPLGSGAAGQKSLDIGAVSVGAGSRTPNVQVRRLKDRMVVVTRFGLAVQDPTRQFASAAVLASLAFPEIHHVVWVDGVKLGTAPQMIQGQARVGAVSAHRLEIEVPASLTERDAQLHNSIIFQVMPN